MPKFSLFGTMRITMNKQITAQELRQKYIDFFVSKGHTQIPSASLVPENDPSVLFTTAGMHPLVPYLKGESHPSGTRLVNYQKCVRTGDIDEVGDNTHLTFFEMLGNWSLGDYFKEDAIKWSFEFLTSNEWLGISLDNLAFTYFAGDENTPEDHESKKLWLDLGVSESRIKSLGKEDNWWPAGGKHPGPQGPDTEMFYWTGDEDAPEEFDPEDSRWVEIWNDVFMQFNQTAEGVLEPLSKQNVDTGMGLERTLAVLQGKKSVFETELFTPILNAIRDLIGDAYDERGARIIADHIRSSVMMISDGVLPSNKDQGYILRRLIRRSLREFHKLGQDSVDVTPVIIASISTLSDAYPELAKMQDQIIEIIVNEGTKFQKTLSRGLKEFEKMFSSKGHVSGEEAFTLYATFGFPLELTQELVEEKGEGVDKDVFAAEFQKHQDISRQGAEKKFAGGLADHSDESKRLHTATHLLHQALRTVLGDHVEQRGSNITQDRLRFDFSHEEKMTDQEKQQVQKIVNEQIEKDLPIHFEMLTVEEAKERGAIGLFEDKYAQVGDKIKVYFVGNEESGCFSKEICGGPHVDRTSELRSFRIKKEESSSAGVRRIKAVLE